MILSRMRSAAYLTSDIGELDYVNSKIVTVRLTPDEIHALTANLQGSRGSQTITALVRRAIQVAYMMATPSQSDPILDPTIQTQAAHKRGSESPAQQVPIRDVLSLKSGTCMFQYPGKMSKQELADLLEWLALLQRKVRRHEEDQPTKE